MLNVTWGVISDVDYSDGSPKTVIFLPKSNYGTFPKWCTALFCTWR